MPPHQRGYCGPKDKETSSLILNFVKDGKGDEKEIRNIFIKNFPVVVGYYKMVSEKAGLDLFDEKVVRGYWTGNELLNVFFKEGKFIPFHLYHVLTSNLSSEDIASCRISLKKNVAIHWER